MNVVVGTDAFSHPGGTESYVITVAHELRRLGHDPVIAARELGPMAELAERRGLRVESELSQLPKACDAVFVQDATVTGPLVERYPDTRVVAFCHSDLFDHQQPVLLSGVLAAVVVASARMQRRVNALELRVPVIRLRHPIDTERFVVRGPIRKRPKRALILSNYLQGGLRETLTSAWEARGVECVQVGAPTRPELDVVPPIAEADIVVAKGRAALEGMSCGRAVYVYDEFGADGWVTPENYAALEADNFAGRVGDELRDPASDLADYDPAMGRRNRELIRRHHTARHHATALVDVLRGPARERSHDISAVGEVSRLARLAWDAERRTLVLEAETARLLERTLAAESESERMRGQLQSCEAEVQGLEALLQTRRAQLGLRLGRALGRLRGRR